MQDIKKSFLEAQSVLNDFIADEKNFIAIQKAGDIIVDAVKNGNKVISCGNGGSMCDAMHFAEEMTGNFREKRGAIPAIAISDSSHITCTSNDYGFEYIFSRYIEALGKPGDVLLAISTSGNSKNIVNAANAAKEKGMKVIGVTGNTGGQLAGMSDVELRTPSSKYADRIQEIHIKIIHTLIEYIEKKVF